MKGGLLLATTIRRMEVAEAMGMSFLEYASYIIKDRALPDVRDGLKPVQRRILYAMHDMGLSPDKPFKKSARVVGEVIGKYHPHGDTSVYEAMVRMAQWFSMRHVLVEGHGNFGSVDDDPAAAMRYTEAKLSRLGALMLGGINKNTVDFVPNFDNEETEPSVLPTLIPNLLLNGVSGIAVGMATNIAPHNLGDLYRALDLILANGLEGLSTSDEEIIQIIQAPDFPTGGQIIGVSGAHEAYRTGRGSITIRSKFEIEDHKGSPRIVITEIPFQVVKSRMIAKMDKLRRESIPAIKEIRDESDKDGIRVVIELKKDAQVQTVVNQLLKKTDMQTTFSMNMTVLVGKQPAEVSLKQALEYFISHAAEVVTRRTQFDLDKAAARAHLVAGIIAAVENVDLVIELTKAAKSDEEAIVSLGEHIGLDEIQAQAVIDRRIRSLTQQNVEKLYQEAEDLQAAITKFQGILEDEAVLLQTIRNEFDEIKSKYATDRLTEIVHEEGSISEADMIQEETLIVTMSSSGLIKSVEEKEYRTQNRGAKGSKAAAVKDDEVIQYLFTVSSKEDLLFFTNQGRCHVLKAFKIQKGSRASRGKSINNYLTLSEGEKVVTMIATDLTSKEEDLLFVTRKGIIKRLSLTELSVRMASTRVISFKEDDALVTAVIVRPENEVMITTARGQSIRIGMDGTGAKQIRPMGRSAAGVVGISLRPEDYVVDMDKVEENGTIFTIGSKGLGKRTDVSEYPSQGRGGKGIVTHNITEKTGDLVCAMMVSDEDDLFVATEMGQVIRIKVNTVRSMGRSTAGVKIMNLNEGDRIVSISKGTADDQPEETEGESESVSQ